MEGALHSTRGDVEVHSSVGWQVRLRMPCCLHTCNPLTKLQIRQNRVLATAVWHVASTFSPILWHSTVHLDTTGSFFKKS